MNHSGDERLTSMWGGVAGRLSSSKLCCSSRFHSKDGIVKSLCSKEVSRLTVHVPSKENLFPSLGRVHRECSGFLPVRPAVLLYKCLGRGVVRSPVLHVASVPGLQPGD